jgi:hypothetical protein
LQASLPSSLLLAALLDALLSSVQWSLALCLLGHLLARFGVSLLLRLENLIFFVKVTLVCFLWLLERFGLAA